MEFALGYLLGSGANWPTIVVALIGCAVIAVVFKAIFGD